MYEVKKAKRKTKCHCFWKCKNTIEKREHYVVTRNGKYCLICAKEYLINYRNYHKNRISNINKALRRIKSYPKEMVVQRLE